MALNPAVEWLQRRGLKRRGAAAGVAYVLALGVIVAIGFAFVPTLVHQVNDFVQTACPDYIDDLTHGRGRLGFLETKYHLVERAREAVTTGGATEAARALEHRGLGHEERDHGRRRASSRSRS